jgi:hypothetical protein
MHKFRLKGNILAKADSPALERPWSRWEEASLSNELLDRIASLVSAKNPSALRRRTFRSYPVDLALMIEVVWSIHHKQTIKFDNITRRQIKQADTIRQLSEELECAIKLSDDSVKLRLQAATARSKLPLDEIGDLAVAARSVAKPSRARISHRPSGTFKHRALDFLVSGLYALIVVEAEGDMTLWQDSGTGRLCGTLPAVLGLLRPYLSGVLPEKIPFSTLYRPIARAKKAHASAKWDLGPLDTNLQ